MLENIDIEKIKEISQKAGNQIMEVYERDFSVEYKDDSFPLTEADKTSHKIITHELETLFPDIPIISEETENVTYEERKNWEYFWIIDPLDGTKEFVNKKGEFTVNIALIKKNRPILGVIYLPTKELFYYGIKDKGSYKQEKGGEPESIKTEKKSEQLKVVASRSHRGDSEMDKFIEQYSKKFHEVNYVSAGSSLKFCLVAEGKAHLYPRFTPTMEWDTAAGDIIATQAGASVYTYSDGKTLKYNKKDMKNPFFVVNSLV